MQGGKGDKGAKPGEGRQGRPPRAARPEAASSAKEAKGQGAQGSGAEVAAAGKVQAAPKDYVARLKSPVRAGDRSRAGQGVRLQKRDGSAEDRQDHPQHGGGRGDGRHEEGDRPR